MRPIKNKQTSIYTIQEATTLLPFMLETLNNKSRNSVKSILTRGQVSVDGKTITQHNYPLKPGQVVEILSNKAAMKQNALTGIEILHEDKDIIVINKDAGVLSMSGKNPNELNAYRQLNDYVKADNPTNHIFIVHRLDRDTSGVMLYAKTVDAQQALQENWKKVVKERTYTAVVEGKVVKEEGTITSWLIENDAMRVYSGPKEKGGKHAVTHYKRIDGNETYSLLEVELETGRKNQIRVHLQDIGHPIVRDKKYGAKTNPLKRLGLHATTLAFIHPATEELKRFTVKPPKSFLKLVK
ncbi:RluA family pseudouridine synthase [Alkalibacterium iburiense]|uniref:Pseudouridine synthase n=1 Tax=Alkalibacterium iburiense TaxID=290589 RepID=A0ABN0XME5_9LACT